MAFQNLRSNNQVYILHKDSNIYLEVGKVVSISVPTPKFGPGSMYNDMTIDLQVDVNGTTMNFQKLPANADIADFGNNIIVACTREIMSNEVMAMKQKSQDIIDSIDIHRNIISKCEEVLLQLNPEIAEKQKQEAENKALREEINQLKDMFKEFMTQLK